jgi:DNA-binding YbaB/EbfC family protein
MKKMPGGMPNMGNMIKQAQKLQQDMMAAQQELAEKEFEVSAGGGAVTIRINGQKQISGMTLTPEIVDPDDIETLTDILIAGVNEAIRVVDEYSANQMKKFTGGMNLPGLF